jgi:predicted RND superfamily exporter protein
MISTFYEKFLLKYPFLTLLFLLSLAAFFAKEAKNISIDASSNTLLMQGDKDYIKTKEINAKFGGGDFLVVVFKPKSGTLLDKNNLDLINTLSNEFSKLSLTKSITSILNVPLLKSSHESLDKILANPPTLKSKNIDLKLAKKEFLSSPLYSNNLVSKDFDTTAILINLKSDKKYDEMENRVDRLYNRYKNKQGSYQEYMRAKDEFKRYRDYYRDLNHNYLEQIRAILQNNQDKAHLFLGGVSMIADDIISFVKKDIKIFGSLVFLLLITILFVIFRDFWWVFSAVLIALLSIIFSTGVLGLLDTEITVVSSNFISFQLIITISIIIHLIVKFNEISASNRQKNKQQIVMLTLKSMFNPILFVVLTTIVGFGSLLFSKILPVIELGKMMSVSVAISFVVAYLFFPLFVMIFNVKTININQSSSFSTLLIDTVFKKRAIILTASFIGIIVALIGSGRLVVENSFVNYFKSNTEIHKGMIVIDRELGGTTPLDVTIHFPDNKAKKSVVINKDKATSTDDDDFDDFDDSEFDTDKDKSYWFDDVKIETIKDVHKYLDSIKYIGKVLSFDTTLKIAKDLKGKDIDAFEIALLYKELPKSIKEVLIYPYIDINASMARFATRVVDSDPSLRRDELIKKIRSDIATKFNIKQEDLILSNLLILYDNVLQSLFKSQISTLSFTISVLLLMFLILFKNIKVALIAISVNMLPIFVILGIMGIASIPLDIMTITIAAISMGIAVDNTIHYIYRFRSELLVDNNYKEAIIRSHKSIGKAMYYTSFAIIVGFCILLFSQFVPTIYFGLLTLLAMFFALFCDLLLLPLLLYIFKPYKI